MVSCVFCGDVKKSKYLENEHAFAVHDIFPVNHGHMLIIPKRHTECSFDLTEKEVMAIHQLIGKCKEILDEKFSPDGYNIGINNGEAAGQTIFHLHVHMIPRYQNDVEKPAGGIRNFKEPLVPYPGL